LKRISLPETRWRDGDHIGPQGGKGILLRILDRYIFREVAVTWLAVTFVLLVILLSNQLARVLSQAAANEFPQGVVLALIGLTTAGYLTIILPIGFFLAIMLALGRLYHESEMAAIQSCGVGPGRLYKPIAMLAAAVAVLLVWLSFWAIPEALRRAQDIRANAYRDAQLGMLEPGRFRTFGDGSVVFYAERVDEFGILHNVHVFVDRSRQRNAAEDAGELEVWVATRAEQRGAGQTEQLFVMYDGEMYQGVPGQGEFRIMQFSEAGFPISVKGGVRSASNAEMKSSRELLASTDLRDRAELQWRISVPVLVLVLMVLAVPLARLRPRQGRFGKIGIAILAYFVYSELLLASRAWIESATVPEYIGMWWVHGLALCIGLWLLARENPGWFTRAEKVRK
jgi:lipopolysaccharide export system permease protein